MNWSNMELICGVGGVSAGGRVIMRAVRNRSQGTTSRRRVRIMGKMLCLLGVVAFTAAGCASNPFSSKAKDPITGATVARSDMKVLSSSSQQRFSDVPLPRRTHVDADRSFVYESDSLQIGRMVYTIHEDVTDVAQFYVRECARLGWTLDSVLESDVTQLLMHKPDKQLIVSIRRLSMFRGGTRLTVQLIPTEMPPGSTSIQASHSTSLRPVNSASIQPLN